jgi:hypothetical protein
MKTKINISKQKKKLQNYSEILSSFIKNKYKQDNHNYLKVDVTNRKQTLLRFHLIFPLLISLIQNIYRFIRLESFKNKNINEKKNNRKINEKFRK